MVFMIEIESSKSLFNRALIIQSFNPGIAILGHSQADDVRHLAVALKNKSLSNELRCNESLSIKSISNTSVIPNAPEPEFFVGEAGTAFRFLFFRLSRLQGRFIIKGHRRLFERPQGGLLEIAPHLNLDIIQADDHWILDAHGWPQQAITLPVSARESSQFLSGLLLSIWRHPFPVTIQSPWLQNPQMGSYDYLTMTLTMLRHFGLSFSILNQQMHVAAHQSPKSLAFRIEPDLSSAAAIILAALIANRDTQNSTQIEYAFDSEQPDKALLKILDLAGLCWRSHTSSIEVRGSQEGQGFDFNLDTCPDLFPCLAVFCCFLKGSTTLRGLQRLKYKESDRLSQTLALLAKAQVVTKLIDSESLIIEGQGLGFHPATFQFDPAQDHRMAMAAGLLQLRNPNIKILHPEVTNKSFPHFWQILNRWKISP